MRTTIGDYIQNDLAARNIKRFGLQKQNLIGITPGGTGEERVEQPTVVGAMKRECLAGESLNYTIS